MASDNRITEARQVQALKDLPVWELLNAIADGLLPDDLPVAPGDTGYGSALIHREGGRDFWRGFLAELDETVKRGEAAAKEKR